MKLYNDIVKKCTTCNASNGFNISGIAIAWTMVDVLKKAGSNLTRASVMDIAANQLDETDNPFLLPGVVVKTTPTDHFPIAQMQVETWNGTGWTAWRDVGGGTLQGDPAAVSRTYGIVDVVGQGTDSALWHAVLKGSF